MPVFSDRVVKILNDMTAEELCGQIINYNVPNFRDIGEFEELVKRMRPGALCAPQKEKGTTKKYIEIVNKYTKVPVIVCAGVENGPGSRLWNEEVFPDPMAWGAADDVELIERAGRVTGQVCHNAGVKWNLAPVVDINYNKDNPVTNVRAISDNAEHVAKIAEAYVRGMQENGNMLAGCKHFPGDGMDDRNQHFCTTINPLSKDEWMKTYGLVFKRMIDAGVASIMVAHVGMPAIEDNIDPILGPLPASLSYNIMTKLLREEMGFEGCIVSDAMAMIGACSVYPPDRLAVEFIKAGGDSLLFGVERDFDSLVEAVKNGELTIERIRQSVGRILTMKERAGLLDSLCDEELELTEDATAIAREIAEKSITVIRNSQNLIPLKPKPNSKFLIINFQEFSKNDDTAPCIKTLGKVAEELTNRGHSVDMYLSRDISHYELEKIKDNYDCILLNSRISSKDYLGGTLRINWDNIMPFWRGVAIDHPCVIFTSFGDPYKLYELPFLRTYVNAYSSSHHTQRAFVKVLLGEIEAKGKSPVELKGFFEREV